MYERHIAEINLRYLLQNKFEGVVCLLKESHNAFLDILEIHYANFKSLEL